MSPPIDIKITNWNKYNPKRAQVVYTWLKLSNDLPTDQKLFGLTAAQKHGWVVLLCIASKQNNGVIKLGPKPYEYFGQLSGLKKDEVLELLNYIKEMDLATLKYTGIHSDVSDERTRQTKKERNATHSLPIQPPKQSVTPRHTELCNIDLIHTSLIGDTESGILLKNISFKTQERWIKLFEDPEYIKREIIKMIIWLEDNAHKRPRSKSGVSRFMTRWLNSGWENHRKGLQSNRGLDMDALKKELGAK